MTIEVIPSDSALGAEIKGVDLSRPLPDEIHEQVEDALAKHGMIFFRDKFLSVEEQEQIIARFGPPNTIEGNVNTKRIKNPHFFDVSNVDDDGEIMSPEDARRVYLLANQLWHSDMSPFERPARVTALHALNLPAIDPPDTQFVDTRLGYERLPESMKKRIEGLQVEHTIIASRAKVGFANFSEWGTSKAVMGAVHPMVRTHARTGQKSLYIGAHADNVVGMPLDEGRALLEELVEMVTTPDLIYSHKWKLHDLVLWDNSGTMHRARPYDDSQKRELRWCSCAELEPV